MTVKPARRLKVCVMKVKDANNNIREVAWFNMPFLANVFHVNQRYVLVGEAVLKNGVLTFQHPKYYTMPEYEQLKHTIQPVYALTEGLTNHFLRKCVAQLRPLMQSEEEYLEPEYRKQHHLMSMADAYEQIHFPLGEESIVDARKRLVFDEFFRFFIYMDSLKEQANGVANPYEIKDSKLAYRLLSNLPYQLTNAQKNTFQEILDDLTGPFVMNRLVQGDVGSGKTIVAVLALLTVVEAGYQGALMAPTEVLANQHYETLTQLLEPFHVSVALLTGSMKGTEKKDCCRRIAEHEVDIIVGTQALIQTSVEYNNLALVVTDEQHRFGVRQRERFAGKGVSPHVLVMSATPIPRTLAMMLYGDMSISVMDELPANRLPVKNCVVGVSYRPAAIRFMKQEIEKGHQVYVICPMVAESETTEAENVMDYADKLSAALPTATIAPLHGKLREEEKTAIMTAFAKGQTDILVSTTVIEVGINVPNATFMLIENAERFGLATLHQLRGRVGRGDAQSFCVFMYGKDTPKTRERLNVLNQSNDGFAIAKEDLRLRGPGDFFGIRQSGEMDFTLGDIYQDADILTLARNHLTECKKKGDIKISNFVDKFLTI
jgi:ATP-dependent DNA helicase RecG